MKRINLVPFTLDLAARNADDYLHLNDKIVQLMGPNEREEEDPHFWFVWFMDLPQNSTAMITHKMNIALTQEKREDEGLSQNYRLLKSLREIRIQKSDLQAALWELLGLLDRYYLSESIPQDSESMELLIVIQLLILNRRVEYIMLVVEVTHVSGFLLKLTPVYGSYFVDCMAKRIILMNQAIGKGVDDVRGALLLEEKDSIEWIDRRLHEKKYVEVIELLKNYLLKTFVQILILVSRIEHSIILKGSFVVLISIERYLKSVEEILSL